MICIPVHIEYRSVAELVMVNYEVIDHKDVIYSFYAGSLLNDGDR